MTGVSALRAYVFDRDGGCVARFAGNRMEVLRWPMFDGLPEPGPCRDKFGGEISPFARWAMEMDHVKTQLGMSVRAPDDIAHAWCVCPGHHTGGTAGRRWATMSVVREAAPAYIAAANAAALERGWPRVPAGFLPAQKEGYPMDAGSDD